MESNTGSQGMKFVERTEMAIMQMVILNKAQQQGGVTRENLQQTFRGNLQMSKDHLQHCIDVLTKEGHLKQEGGKLTITDDGREDVQKLQHLVLELPNVVGGQTQRPGQTQQATTGGAGAGSPRSGGMGNPSGTMGGSTTGQTTGNQGSVGTSSPQGGGVGQSTEGKGSVNKGGATGNR